MTTVLLIIHLMVAIALVVTVLLQRSEGGALGIGGGGGGFMTARGAGNILTRATAILAACFFATSIGLSILAGYDRQAGSILDAEPAVEAPVEPEAAPSAAPAPAPEIPSAPSAD